MSQTLKAIQKVIGYGATITFTKSPAGIQATIIKEIPTAEKPEGIIQYCLMSQREINIQQIEDVDRKFGQIIIRALQIIKHQTNLSGDE